MALPGVIGALGVGRGAAAPTPESILGSLLYADWDARRTDLLSFATGVSSWRDRVASIDQVQGVGAAQPVYGATAFHGGPGLTFDGVNDYLLATLTSALASGTRPYAWIVGNVTLNAITYLASLLASTSGGTLGYLTLYSSAIGGQFRSERSDGVSGASANWSGTANTSRHLFEIGWTAGGSNTIVVDGVGANGAQATALSTPINYVQLGAVRVPASFALGGALARVIVSNDEPSAQQKLDMRSYMSGPNFPGYTSNSYL
jgi:hypothetical protein